jgi:hypothetical protein
MDRVDHSLVFRRPLIWALPRFCQLKYALRTRHYGLVHHLPVDRDRITGRIRRGSFFLRYRGSSLLCKHTLFRALANQT